MNYIERVNNLVKEIKIQTLKNPHYNALEYTINKETIDLLNPNKFVYQVNLDLEIENLKLKSIKSDWLSNVDEAKYQCCQKVYEYLINQPSVSAIPEKKSLINGITLRLIIVLSILLSIMLLVPILFYFLLPFSFSIILLLSIPYILYRNNRILKSVGEKEDGVVRKCKSFDFFECPITNINKGELFIDLSNDRIEIQDVSKDNNFIAKAENKINLDLVPTQINSHKIKIYTFQKESHLRIRKSANGFYTSTIRILLVDGLELTYFNPNVPKESFTETDFPLLKVMSQYGVHYFPYNLSDPVEMREIEKYQTILEIHFNQLISFNIKNLFK
ncbi:hypothetical protein ACTFIV_005687 [Dictyostelium citrinum]